MVITYQAYTAYSKVYSTMFKDDNYLSNVKDIIYSHCRNNQSENGKVTVMLFLPTCKNG